jgi:hypothetical protein
VTEPEEVPRDATASALAPSPTFAPPESEVPKKTEDRGSKAILGGPFALRGFAGLRDFAVKDLPFIRGIRRRNRLIPGVRKRRI